MRYRCTACRNNCTPPGKLRGFKLRDHTCPCGGSLARGTNADGESVPAVPLAPEQRADRAYVPKRTHGEMRLEVVLLLCGGFSFLAGIGLAALAYMAGRHASSDRLRDQMLAVQDSLFATSARLTAVEVLCNAPRPLLPPSGGRR